MEALMHLERVQSSLSLMQVEGISTGEPDSDRFVAEFLLFMMQQRSVNYDKACQLICKYLPKISVLLKENAGGSNEVFEGKNEKFQGDFYLKKMGNLVAPGIDEWQPAIGLSAMEKAKSTLEDFCRSYFMFHGMDSNNPNQIFKFLPVLFFTESYIYQLDIVNENILCSSVENANRPEESSGANNCSNETIWSKTQPHSEEKLISFNPLLLLLQGLGLLTERIEAELRLGLEYWYLERKLCLSLAAKSEILLEDVMRAMHLKSFDYRVLHLLLYQLNNEKVNELHMEFLSVSELLVEISDDLYDYEEDVIENNFNILRMFVRLYGPQTAPPQLAKRVTQIEEKYQYLLKELSPDLSFNYQRRCEEATLEGGNKSGYSFGTWNIPSVVTDEDHYRSKFKSMHVLSD
ncbi:ATP synthase subunit B [Wolffia australiana]